MCARAPTGVKVRNSCGVGGGGEWLVMEGSEKIKKESEDTKGGGSDFPHTEVTKDAVLKGNRQEDRLPTVRAGKEKRRKNASE